MRSSNPILTLFLVLNSVLLSWNFALAAPGAQAISLDDVRRIVREELRAREAQLEKREAAVAAREVAVTQKLERLDHLVSAGENANLKNVTAPGPFSLEVSGYGDIQADFHSRAESEDQPEGARGQSKSTFDTERFVLELEGKHEPSGVEVEAEIEFEHGGTGVTQEIEHDEFGEFETEVEKGGEVIVEELYLNKDFGEGFSGKLGRFYVALGTLSRYYRPTDYLAARRSEVEEVMLPGQWDEIGAELSKEFEFGRVTLQLVNGLDSSGFGSEHWIASGHQSSFEGVRAEDLAIVGRLDVHSIYPGLSLGTSIYAGNTSGNRPKADLDVDGTVVLGSADFRYWSDSLKAQGAFYLGHLEDAQEISERNSRLSNSQGVERSPVADGALGVWSEVGYNVSPHFEISEQHEVLPFVRFDYYDTYYDRRSSLPDNGRFERFVYTAGLAYIYDDFLTLKLDWSRREFGEQEIAEQNLIGFSAGFVY